MRRLLQRLLLPLAMVAVTQTSFVSAESIRLKGPNGEIQNAPQYAEPILNSLQNSEPSRFYGPTLENETLWSIASKLRPSNTVTVQQTLYAIYQLNPQAFDNQNIHELNPRSTIRVPSLNQVSSVSNQEAVRILNAHQARLQQSSATSAKVASASSQPKSQTTPSAQKVSAPAVTPTEPAKPEVSAVEGKADLVQIAKEQKSAQESTLKNQLASSESELVALEEKNHKLRLMLAQVQNEVEVLKNELGDENRIRNEVEKLLEAERLRLAEEKKSAPSTMESLFSNTWLVAALAIIPGLLIGLLTVMLLGRRKQNEEQTEQAQTQPELEPQVAAPIAATALNNNLDDELDLDDDLFGDSMELESSNTDEQAIELDGTEDEDIFAGLDDDLDFNLENENGEDPFAGIGENGDLDLEESLTDLDLSTSDISVNGKEKALGIEEMERALDEATLDEQSGEEEFELSDDGMISQDDLDSLFNSEIEHQEQESEPLQQAMLDELFNDVGSDANDKSDTQASLGAFDEDEFDLSDDSDSSLNEPKIASDEDIEDIFAQIEARADLDALEVSATDETALLDELLEDNAFELDENSTDLLDEFVDDSEPELAGVSTEEAESSLFDELMGVEDEPKSALDDSENSEEATHLDPMFDLDAEFEDLLGSDTQENAIPLESSELLDELIDTPDAQTESEDFGDEGTDLFEELLEIEKQNLEAPISEEIPEHELKFDEGQQESSEGFSSEEFIDDMLSTAPQADALLDELHLGDDESVENEIEPVNLDSDISETEESAILDEEDDWLSSAIEEVENPQTEETLDIEDEPSVSEHTSSVEELDDREPEFLAPQEQEEETDEDDWLTSAIEEVEQGEVVEDEFTPELSDIEPASENVESDEPQEIVHEDIALGDIAQENIAEQPLETTESQAEDFEQPAQMPSPEAIPNEFGIPQDDDWLLEDSTDTSNMASQPEPEADSAPVNEEVTEPEESFNFDDLELPEYSEEDAIADMAMEPGLEADSAPVDAEVTEPEESFNFDDLELPEYSEEDAIADMALEPDLESESAPVNMEVSESEESFSFDDSELPEYSEQDAFADLFSTNSLEADSTETKQNLDNLVDDFSVSAEPTNDNEADYHHAEFDQKAFDELLSDQPDNETPNFAFDKPVDETVSDSAGLDIEAMLEMGGEDWNGFALSPEQQAQISDDIPEEEQVIWSEGNPPAEAKVSDENWEDQKDIEDFNPREHQYRTIDELMAEVDAEGEQEVDDTLQLDVGLSDFPDVIGSISSYEDSDANAEAAGKLDLAKIYMEMNDAMGARKLLEEAIVDGSDDIRREAKSLIDSIGQS